MLAVEETSSSLMVGVVDVVVIGDIETRAVERRLATPTREVFALYNGAPESVNVDCVLYVILRFPGITELFDVPTRAVTGFVP